MFADTTIKLYLLIGIISTGGVVLFTYWMIRYNWYRSVVFCYVTLLLAGEATRAWICLYGRGLLIDDPAAFWEFSLTWVWSFRLILSLVSVSAIVGHMAYRAVTRASNKE